jgi:phosphoribosyl-AMP cyclohydrolase / phosphoribosyl-ATP pyrophosphohydrolase
MKHQKPNFIPTLDISQGKAVLVKHGEIYKILGNPLEKAQFLSIHNSIQVIDLDAAMNKGSNREIIKKIARKYPCYVGGGIRTYEDASYFLDSSAKRVIISTALSYELVSKIPKNRLIVAFDIDEEYRVFTHGRGHYHEKKLFDLIEEYKEYIEVMTITFHCAEGTCQGIPLNQVKEINQYLEKYEKYKSLNIRLIVAGGIHTIQEINDLLDLDVIPQFGSGFWNGHFTLGDVFESLAKRASKFVEHHGVKLVPTIVQSIEGIVLGLVFCTPESIKTSVDTRIATFFSRDRNSLWVKGATSGEYHQVKGIHFCCDGTSIRMVVEGNTFCHTGSESCFGYSDPSRANLRSIQRLIQQKIKGNLSEKSYTKSLLQDKFKINSKIMEEAEELICAKGYDEIVHETADLIYFMLMFLQKHEVEIRDVESELIKRRYHVANHKKEIVIKNKEKLKIGIMTTNVPKNAIIDYLQELFHTKITKKNESDRNYEYLCENNNLVIIPTKPKDVAVLMNNGFLDAVVSYEDIILNYSVNAEKIGVTQNKNKSVKIIIACQRGMNIEKLKEINKSNKLTIMAEYVELTSDWVRKHNLDAKIVHVHGSSESYLVNNLCDLCVVVCDSGTTLKENNLEILDVIVETSLNLFVHPSKKEMFFKLLK